MAIGIAQAFETSIISADSRQFYREMTIGTAKPSEKELALVPHFFINSLSIHDNYSAGDFEKDALAKLHELFLDHDVLVMVGGSGLFINAVCTGLDDLPKPSPGIREKLNKSYEEFGLPWLQKKLARVDPVYYAEADVYNPQRVIRALEVFESTGKPFSYFRKNQSKPRPFRCIMIGLNTARETLYHHINTRVDAMMQQGLLTEVKKLAPNRHLPPLLTVGYSELFDHLDGKFALEIAVDKIKQHTRQFAKRQITWFKKNEQIYWFEPTQLNEIIAFIRTTLGNQQ